jgi:type II secretory pathway pseudopilin PulG
LVVIAVIMIVAVIAVPNSRGVRRASNEAAAVGGLRTCAGAEMTYYTINGAYGTLADFNTAHSARHRTTHRKQSRQLSLFKFRVQACSLLFSQPASCENQAASRLDSDLISAVDFVSGNGRQRLAYC